MRPSDLARWAWTSLRAEGRRSFLTALGIAIGIAAVTLLTSIGEGLHRFVVGEFTQFGTHIAVVQPGRTTTHGIPGGVFGTVRPLTIEDAEAIERLPEVIAAVPAVQGNAEVRAGRRTRRTTVYGVDSDMPVALRFGVAMGRYLPPEPDPRRPRPFAVLGPKLRRELFGDRNPIGERIRIGGRNFLVIGVAARKGTVLGFDLDDAVHIPAALALEHFNRESLMEIDILYRAGVPPEEVKAAIRSLLLRRHGREDFTVITQQQMLETLGSVLDILTLAVGALGGISLLVGAVGIVTMMTIAVEERTAEVGLLRALGARRRDIRTAFLTEAALLSAAGGAGGLAIGAGACAGLQALVPGLPVHTTWEFVLLAEAFAAAVGLVAGVYPALRAASLDPVEALRAE